MTPPLEIRFASLATSLSPATALFVSADVAFAARGQELDQKSGGFLARAASAAGFTGKAKQSVEVLAPPKLDCTRVLLLGVAVEMSSQEQVLLGGRVLAALKARRSESASIVAELAAKSAIDPVDFAVALAEGAMLRSYEFRRYRSRDIDDSNGNGNGDEPAAANGKGGPLRTLVIHVARPEQAAEKFRARRAVVDGVNLARELVNEPANMLGPVEFAGRVMALKKAGVDVEILDVPELEKLKMGALLGVAQGSARPARVAIMQWHGAKSKRTKPVCFVGKGVVFDTGGISMKPAAGMEDMKGDMGGAACVTGLMLALAGRKANVNAVGIIGLVENMPSGRAMRPGDIIGSMSGQTIEVLNTDAEGRLVLCDLLHYAQERFKPKFIVDLATLTGAIMVALGKEYAGLFSNNDRLALWLHEAGEATGERLWRMPMDAAYDKEIDSKNADMKNIGGQFGGSITAAQFLKRFVGDVPWAHIDIAGVALASNRSEVSESWSSGFGVRLLDRLVADHYEG